jgi:PrtD family type I secretion system ABC transporter
MRKILSEIKPYFLPLAAFSFGMHMLLLAPSIYMLMVYDRVLTSRSLETLTVLTFGTVVALLLNLALEVARSRLLSLVGMAVERALGPTVLDAILVRAARSGQLGQTGELRDVAQIKGFLSGIGATALLDAPWLPIYLIVIFMFHPAMGACAVVGMIIMLGMGWLSERVTKPRVERSMVQARSVNHYMESGLRNAEVINVLGMGGTLTKQWGFRNDELLRLQWELTTVSTWIQGSGRFIRQALQVAMMAVGAYLVLHDNAAPGVMMAATMILGRLLQPMESLLAGWKGFVEVRSASQRIATLLKVHVSPDAPMALPAPQGKLTIDRVVYGVRMGDKAIIKGVSLGLEAGESLAIIGPSGAGKSTLARLMVGLLRPQGGVVRIDETDMAQWPRDALGPHIGYVPQDVELFACSVAENIARLGALDGASVVAAARQAQVHDMISKLPEGYATQLGEGGMSVSAGQRQRIALARALYGNPRLLVMDEPNSNLDTEGEHALSKVMATLKAQGVTQVIVTHRPNLLNVVDKVLVLREGQVEMFGPRDEVLSKVLRPIQPTVPLTVVPAKLGGHS